MDLFKLDYGTYFFLMLLYLYILVVACCPILHIFTRTLSPFIPPLFFSTLFFSTLFFSTLFFSSFFLLFFSPLFFSLGRSVSRHPNYYCEVTMWWCVYLFSIASTGNILNFSIVGCVWLTVSPTRLFCHTQQA